MKKPCLSMVTLTVVLFLFMPSALAEVKWQINNTLSLEQPPLDTAASVDGKWIFILTEAGKVQIHAADGSLRDTIEMGSHVDNIQAGAENNVLYLQSRKKKSVETLLIEFIHEFDLKGSPVKGPLEAPVTIVEFSDFECTYCSRVVGLLDEVLEKNPETVKLVFKHFPLSSHKYAVKAAMASMAAKEEGKFWPFHDELFKNYNRLNDEKVAEIAKALDLDQEAFDQKSKDPAVLDQIKRDYKQGVDAGVRGTPTLYLNGQLIRDRSLNGIQSMIDSALKESKE